MSIRRSLDLLLVALLASTAAVPAWSADEATAAQRRRIAEERAAVEARAKAGAGGVRRAVCGDRLRRSRESRAPRESAAARRRSRHARRRGAQAPCGPALASDRATPSGICPDAADRRGALARPEGCGNAGARCTIAIAAARDRGRSPGGCLCGRRAGCAAGRSIGTPRFGGGGSPRSRRGPQSRTREQASARQSAAGGGELSVYLSRASTRTSASDRLSPPPRARCLALDTSISLASRGGRVWTIAPNSLGVK